MAVEWTTWLALVPSAFALTMVTIALMAARSRRDDRDVTLAMSRMRPGGRRRWERSVLLDGVGIRPTNRAALAAADRAAAAHDDEEDAHGRGHR